MAGMHRVLYLIVNASNETDAINTATDAFENELKADERTTYDYCKPMESGHNVAGSDRWNAFADEPIAAPFSSQQAIHWIERGLDDTKRNFAGNLYRFFVNAQKILEESVETGPGALDELLEYARDNPGQSRNDAADALLAEYPRTLDALYDGGDLQHRYNAGQLAEAGLMEAHVFDCVSYQTITAADGSYRTENVREMLDERPSDVWVVPLDAHF